MEENLRLSVLVSAHEVSPVLGSECSSGWNILTRLGEHHDLTILYAETNQFKTNNYKFEVEKFLKENSYIKGKFLSIPQPKITRLIAKFNHFISGPKTSVGIPPLYFLGVYFWERSVLKIAKHLHKFNNYDLVHHFNHLSYREPGFLYKLNLPIIWGPMSGTSNLPYPFLDGKPLSFKIKFIVRNCLNSLRNNFSLRIGRSIKRASKILFVTSDDKLFLQSKGASSFRASLDVGTNLQREENFSSPLDKKNQSDLNLIWIGRLDYLKSLDLLLEALASDAKLASKTKLSVIGDGELLSVLKKKALDLELNNVTWHGLIEHNQVINLMLQADILVHTSIKEAGSAVVLESLSAGLPVICHDAFGFSHTINDKCGIKIPFRTPSESIMGFQRAILKCVEDSDLVASMKQGAIQRASDFTWESLAQSISDDYLEVIQREKYRKV